MNYSKAAAFRSRHRPRQPPQKPTWDPRSNQFPSFLPQQVSTIPPLLSAFFQPNVYL